MIFPFFFIFVLGNLLLNTFPGWLRGFSNTFGLYLAQLLGMNKILGRFLYSNKEETLDKIRTNPAPIINELDIKNIKIVDNNGKKEIQWSQLDKLNDNLIKQENTQDTNEIKRKFAYFVLIKIWLLTLYGMFYWEPLQFTLQYQWF